MHNQHTLRSCWFFVHFTQLELLPEIDTALQILPVNAYWPTYLQIQMIIILWLVGPSSFVTRGWLGRGNFYDFSFNNRSDAKCCRCTTAIGRWWWLIINVFELDSLYRV